MRLNLVPAMVVVAFAALIGGCGEGGGSSTPAPSSGGGSSSTPTPAPAPSGPAVGTGGGSKPQIGMIPRGDGAVYWRAVEAGAQKAVAEGPKGADGKPVLDLVWEDPGKPGAQVDAAKELIGKGVAAIVVAPEDEAALSGIVIAAGRVPVIAIGGDFKVDKVRSVIGVDQAKAAELADQKAPGPKDLVKIASFGVTTDDLAKIDSGKLNALVIANPEEIGAVAIKTASQCMKERKVDKRINVAWRVVTKDTLNSPENASLWGLTY